jgi:integrase
MPIVKLNSGSFQAKIVGPDGKTISKTFLHRRDAAQQLTRWKTEKRQNRLQANKKLPTLDEYFLRWFTDISQERRDEDQSGWRKVQLQIYRDYIRPDLGSISLEEIKPEMVKRVVNRVGQLGRSPTTQRHVFVLMRRLLGDAIEIYQHLAFNPALRKFNPEIAVYEAKRLNIKQIKSLLLHVEDKKYGLAIWLQLYLGLRCGELQALKWEDVDLEDRRVVIRRTFVKHVGRLREYPKGKKQHSHSIPLELWERLVLARQTAKSEFVVPSPAGPQYILPHHWYLKFLKRYCLDLGIPAVGTHGLRHSTSEIYLQAGASRDDLRQLFAHSSLVVTDRYIRGKASNLERVSNVIKLFPKENGEGEDSKNVHENVHA